MKRIPVPSSRHAGAVVALVLLATSLPLVAFPPALHQEVFGMIRDERGNPLSRSGTEVLMEVGTTVVARATVGTTPVNGSNYRLVIPLDTGATPERYQPTALLPAVGFRLRVRVGNATFLPMEMTGTAALSTKPGAVRRTDLTLGEDSDGDGIPDAWERDLIAALGLGKTIADIRPGDDADGDGLSNLNEYLAGTYAFDPADGFTLSIRGTQGAGAGLEFTAVRGRTYTVVASNDFQSWDAQSFVLQGDATGASPRRNFTVADGRTRLVRIWTRPTTGQPSAADPEAPYKFYRLQVQ